MHILMLAAENAALSGGKVGGLGDVIRDLPQALGQAGHQVTVLMPAYGVFNHMPGASFLGSVPARFSGSVEQVQLLELASAGSAQSARVKTVVMDHPLFSVAGSGTIYTDDGEGPFATDAHRFALASSAAAEVVLSGLLTDVDVIHCHDWHTGAFLFLRCFDPYYSTLRQIPAVFTIHNLSLQGIRPFQGHWSALESWFPNIDYDPSWLADRRYSDCINLMRCGINLADRVNTVSPTYAREITHPSDWAQAVAGGDGLESDLQRLAQAGSLEGILNGCDYEVKAAKPLGPVKLWPLIEDQLDVLAAKSPVAASHYFALKKISELRRRSQQPTPLILSISRLSFQKMGLLTCAWGEETILDAMLAGLDQGLYLLLGSGDAYHDQFFSKKMRQHENFLYLCGFSEELADRLYASCDLFLMPSVFEPCGISQMLAMRAGMPCLVHKTGGLNDTVRDGHNGFSFGGSSLEEKLQHLLLCWERALRLFTDKPQQWQEIQQQAASTRLTWDSAVQQYLTRLYQA